MKSSRATLSFAAACVIASGLSLPVSNSAQAATLAGETVTINLTINGNNNEGTQNPLVVNGFDGNYFGSQQYDFNFGGNNVFALSSTNSYLDYLVPGEPVTYTLSNLNFGSPLTSFTILQTAMATVVNSISATSVQFTLTDGPIPQGVYFQGAFGTAVTAVPGPIAGAGLVPLLGLAGAWLMRRRRQSKLAA